MNIVLHRSVTKGIMIVKICPKSTQFTVLLNKLQD